MAVVEPVALAHDYATQRGGAERVALVMALAFPGAPMYTTLYHAAGTFPEFGEVDLRTSAINRIGLLRRHHRLALPLLASAVSSQHVDAEVLLASSSGWAHGYRGAGRTVVVGSIMTEPVGRELFAFARFARDGSPDATFGDGGQTTIDFGDVSAAPGAGLLQGDRIVAVGSVKTVWPPNEGSGNADVAVARLRDDGTLDRAFGDDGLAIVAIDRTPDAYDLAYDAIGTVDGGLAIVGATESDGGDGRGFLMRLDANGAPLPGFADGGARIFDDVINGENAATTFTGIAAAGSGYIVTGHSGATPTPVTQGLVARVEGAALGRHSRHRIKMPRVPVRIGAAPRGAAPRAGAGG